MGKIPDRLRDTICRNIRECRMKKFPGRGGGKKCAEKFGVSPQQWSPWESGKRTPDEYRLEQIAEFFAVTVEWLRKDHRNEQPPLDSVAANTHGMSVSQSTESQPDPNFVYDIMRTLMDLHQRCVNYLHREYGDGRQTNARTAPERRAASGEPTESADPMASE